MPKCANHTAIEGDYHRAEIRDFFLRQSKIVNDQRAAVLSENYEREKEGRARLYVPPKYSIETFAKELSCNPNTLRKFLGGRGRLSLAVWARFKRMCEEAEDPDFVAVLVPYSWTQPCLKCGERFVSRGSHNVNCPKCVGLNVTLVSLKRS